MAQPVFGCTNSGPRSHLLTVFSDLPQNVRLRQEVSKIHKFGTDSHGINHFSALRRSVVPEFNVEVLRQR